jgi:hypothetical protein
VGCDGGGEIRQTAEPAVEIDEPIQRVSLGRHTGSSIDRHPDGSNVSYWTFAFFHHQPFGCRSYVLAVQEQVSILRDVGEPRIWRRIVRSFKETRHQYVVSRRGVHRLVGPILEPVKRLNTARRIDAPRRNLCQIISGACHLGKSRVER